MIRDFLNCNFCFRWRSICTPLLALIWCIGLLLGVCAAHTASDTLIPMMRGAAISPVSISGLLTVAVLPFLLSAFAVFLYEPLLLLICGLKAFSFGFCTYGISLAFGSAGWLVRFFLLFSDICMIPLLLFYWFTQLSGKPKRTGIVFAACLFCAVLVGIVDYRLISPFLVTLITN